MPRPLKEYARKRNFGITSEPPSKLAAKKKSKLIFVVQEHHASHLHYDFRLEWDGVLKSWAVPKGPSLDPAQKRLAVQVEDHPLAYATFVGTIPEKQYGAGEVYRWDMGKWTPKNDPSSGLKKGRLEFDLEGDKLHGGFILVRTRAQTSGKAQWLLIKRHDRYAREGAEEFPVQKKKTKKTSTKLKISASKTKDEEPHFVKPQLALLVTKPPEGNDWVHEIKFDGYRTQALIQNKKVNLITRGELDWTDKYTPIAQFLKKLPVESATLDGEIIWQNEKGHSDFQKLQNSLKSKDTGSLVFWAFDLLHLNGEDLTSLPLIARKDRLEKLIKKLDNDRIRYSDHFRGLGDQMIKESCKLGLEGVISKRIEAPYISGRHGEWVKSKCIKRQEFVIGGFTDPEGSRTGFGSLLLGVYEGSKLKYVGKCGTGFDEKSLREVHAKMKKLEIENTPFELKSPRSKNIHFIKPKLVAEVSFANWTQDEVLRVPVFHALRSDKAPEEISIEKPKPLSKAEKMRTSPVKKSVKTAVHISSTDRIVYKKEKITKGEIAEYYQAVSKWMLPHLINRPLSLLRCPSMKQCFYAKHFTPLPDNLIALPKVKGINHDAPFFTIDSVEGLLTLVQMGAIEIHPWNCHAPKLDRPDQIVMDFDPDPSLDFKIVKEGALELREILQELGIESFVKTTGGKGLHVQFQFEPLYDWDSVKEFSKTLAQEMASRHPDLYTTNIRKETRKKKIFLDYLRNGLGSTAVAPYALRAHDQSSVALPIEWEELKHLKSSDAFDMRTALKLIAKRPNDPWKKYFSKKQKIKILQ